MTEEDLQAIGERCEIARAEYYNTTCACTDMEKIDPVFHDIPALIAEVELQVGLRFVAEQNADSLEAEVESLKNRDENLRKTIAYWAEILGYHPQYPNSFNHMVYRGLGDKHKMIQSPLETEVEKLKAENADIMKACEDASVPMKNHIEHIQAHGGHPEISRRALAILQAILTKTKPDEPERTKR